MKNLSRTFLRIGIIISWVVFGLLVFSGIVCIVLGVLPPIHDAIREGYTNSPNANEFASADAAVYFYIGTMIASGVVCLFFIPLPIINAVISNKALNEPNRGLLIASIVLGAMCSKFTLAGGILGLLAHIRERRNSNVIDQ